MEMDIGMIFDVIITFNNVMDEIERQDKGSRDGSVRKARPGESIRTIFGG